MKKLLVSELKRSSTLAEKHILECGYTNIQIDEKPEEGWVMDISFDFNELRVILSFEDDHSNPIGLCFKKDEEDNVDNPIIDYDILNVVEPEVSLFIQLSDDKKTVRYFSVGTYINDLFTGMVYGYEGGGEFTDRFVYENKFLPSYSCGEPIEWDELLDIFESVSPYNYESIDGILRGYMDFNSTTYIWELEEDALAHFEGQNVFTISMYCEPISYGHTSWKTTKDTNEWEIDELKSNFESKGLANDFLDDLVA